MTLAQHKRELRAQLLSDRIAWRSAQQPWREEALCAQLRVLLQRSPHIRVVAGYRGMPGELDPTRALKMALRMGRQVVCPRVNAQQEMDFVRVHDLEQGFYRSALGVREPYGEVMALDRVQLILVPGLAFDLRGGRLGLGKGFYDRTLARARSLQRSPYAIGVCHEEQLRDSLPLEAHDERVDGLLTPYRAMLLR